MSLDSSNVMTSLLPIKLYKVKYGGVWKIWNPKTAEAPENPENSKQTELSTSNHCNNLKRKQTDLEQICILAKISRDLT